MQSQQRQRSGDAAADVPGHAGRDKAQQGAGAHLRPDGRRQQRAFHRQLLAAPPERFQRGQHARRCAGHGAGRLADHLRRARAVLHEGGMGAGRLRRAGPVRSAAVAAVSDAAAAGEVLGRAAGARRAGARASPAAVADGDQLAALQRAAGVPALRLLPVLHVRVPGEVDVDGDHAAAGGGDRPLRDPVRTATWRASRPGRTAAPRASPTSTPQKRLQLQRAKAVVLCANGAETPRLLLNSESARFPNGLANSSGVVGKHLMFNTYFGVERAVRASAQRVQERAEHAHRARFLRHGSEARILRRRRHRRALRQVPDHFSRSADCRRDRRRGAKVSPAVSPSSSRERCSSDATARRCRSRSNSVTHRPRAQGCVGAAVHARHLQGSSGRSEERRVPELAGACEIAQAAGALKAWPEPIQPQTQSVHLLGTCRMGNDPRTSVIDRFHRTHDVRNLFICDGSSMVTSSRGQPTETISALAFRAGEHIAAFAKRGEI